MYFWKSLRAKNMWNCTAQCKTLSPLGNGFKAQKPNHIHWHKSSICLCMAKNHAICFSRSLKSPIISFLKVSGLKSRFWQVRWKSSWPRAHTTSHITIWNILLGQQKLLNRCDHNHRQSCPRIFEFSFNSKGIIRSIDLIKQCLITPLMFWIGKLVVLVHSAIKYDNLLPTGRKPMKCFLTTSSLSHL